jgi:hypothetical protein
MNIEEFIKQFSYRCEKHGTKDFAYIEDLRALFKDKVLVPVSSIISVEQNFDFTAKTQIHTPFVRVNFGPSDFDGRDKFLAMLTASQEPKQ